MRRSALRVLVILSGVALLVAGGVKSGLRYVLHQSAPPAQGRLTVTSLDGPVRTLRDPFGVPHIMAESQRDAFLALGFSHAQDRFWQMELLRRAAHGTLSELFGRSSLETDRLARTLGLARAAREESQILSKQANTILTAYSAGVNLYLEQAQEQRELLPVELRWLEVAPEPWMPADSLALVRMRAWMLGRSLRASLLLNGLRNQIGGVASQDFFPVRPIDATPELMGSLLRLGRTADALAHAVGLGERAGSLGFVITGSRSESGLPILANDPHVTFRLPPLFYAAHLSTPDLDLSGGTWPGVPVFWTGTNRQIAWGQVIVHASVTDLFEETLHPEDPYRYYRGGRWRDVERHVESVPVRGAPPVPIEIIRTRNGPLLGSVYPEETTTRAVALRWTGQDKRSGIEALLRVQRVTDWNDFRHALRRFPGPPSTFLYANRQGGIGTQVAGHFPIRAIKTGLLPVLGYSRHYDWRGHIPFKELPHQFGEELPWLIASSQPKGFTFPHAVSWLWKSGGAEERLRALLGRDLKLTIDDVVAIQRDRHSARGVQVVRRLLHGVEPERAGSTGIRDILLEWDGSTDIDSRGACAYHVFRHQLAKLMLRDRVDATMAEALSNLNEPLPGVLLARFVDRAGPRQARTLIERALDETRNTLRIEVSSNPRKWVWAQIHQLRLPHDFERLGRGPLAWFGWHLSRGPFPVAGDADSVWTMHHCAVPTAGIGVGPAFRYAIDLADLGHARIGLAGGQSGHPGSAHYDDAISDWLRGQPRFLWTHWGDIEYHQVGTWELLPVSEQARGE